MNEQGMLEIVPYEARRNIVTGPNNGKSIRTSTLYILLPGAIRERKMASINGVAQGMELPLKCENVREMVKTKPN